MKIYFILFCSSLSFFGTAQNLETNDKLNQFRSNSFNCQPVEDSIGKPRENDTEYNKIRYGVSINQSITRYGLPTAVLFTLHYKKHQFDIGPQFRLGKSINEFQKNIGGEFNYRFYVTGDTNRFSSYVLFNADYFYQFKKENTIFISSDPNLNGQKSVRTTKYHDVEFNVGYGIKFKLVGGVYLGANIGVGFYKENSSFENMVLESTKYKSHETSIGFIGTVLMGYKF
jgi:hypothetical protein